LDSLITTKILIDYTKGINSAQTVTELFNTSTKFLNIER